MMVDLCGEKYEGDTTTRTSFTTFAQLLYKVH